MNNLQQITSDSSRIAQSVVDLVPYIVLMVFAILMIVGFLFVVRSEV